MDDFKRPLTLQEVCIQKLQEILAELQAMQPLPVIGSEEYFADISAYRASGKEIDDLYDTAKTAALMTIPDEVKAVFEPIEQRRRKLLDLG